MEVVSGGEGTAGLEAVPMETTVALDGQPGCIAEARHVAAGFLAHVAAERGVPVCGRALDSTQLVVSELVTNSLKYAPGPVLLELRFTDDAVAVTVWDSEPALPRPRGADPARVGQHGLEIVMAVARDYEVRRESVGKRVTACITLGGDRTAG